MPPKNEPVPKLDSAPLARVVVAAAAAVVAADPEPDEAATTRVVVAATVEEARPADSAATGSRVAQGVARQLRIAWASEPLLMTH